MIYLFGSWSLFGICLGFDYWDLELGSYCFSSFFFMLFMVTLLSFVSAHAEPPYSLRLCVSVANYFNITRSCFDEALCIVRSAPCLGFNSLSIINYPYMFFYLESCVWSPESRYFFMLFISSQTSLFFEAFLKR